MKAIILMLGISAISFNKGFSQSSHNTDIASKYTVIKFVGNDSVPQMRIPLNLLNKDIKYRVDALQKQLDGLGSKAAANDFSDFRRSIAAPTQLLQSIEGDDRELVTAGYHRELDYYSSLYDRKLSIQKKEELRQDSINELLNSTPASIPSSSTGSSGSYSSGSSSHQIQTGPRGGQYYINKNGKKTYVKKK